MPFPPYPTASLKGTAFRPYVAFPGLPPSLAPGRVPHVRPSVHGLNTTFFQCFHHRSPPTYRKRKRRGFAHLVQPMYAWANMGTRRGGKAGEQARDWSHNQRMKLTSSGCLSRRHMGHAGVYRLARLDIDTRRIVFKAIDGFANWSLRNGRSGSRCLWIRHRVSPYFSTTRLEVCEGSAAAFSATISRISGAAS